MKKVLAVVLAFVIQAAAWPAFAVPARVISGDSVQLLDMSGVQQTVTGTTAETTLASVNVPGGLMGENGAVRITALFSYTNSANTKTLRVKWGAGNAFVSGPTTSNAFLLSVVIYNRGTTGQQVSQPAGLAGTGTSTVDPAYASLDTSKDQTISFTGTLSNTSEQIKLESYIVEVIKP
jgi:hypothetical protein